MKVKNVRKYANFAEMIVREDFRRIIPGLTAEEILETLRHIYTAEKEALGVVVIDIRPIESVDE